MMMQQMRGIDFAGKSVLDFGTGTGVLAILAGKLGASKVVAIDNDEWSIENAKENATRNDCELVELRKAESAQLDQNFDVILANINRNVILNNMTTLSRQLNKGGVLLLSGILREDAAVINEAAEKQGLVYGDRAEKDNWLCIRFVRYA
jgi:ribosomal protein L11 methyltransferase